MKKIIVLLALSQCYTIAEQSSLSSKLILLDQIDVVIVGHDDTEIITRSDLDRQSLGGGYRTQGDIIFEKEIVLDAKKLQLPKDPETVDAGLTQMQREYNITPEEMESIFKASGFLSYEEGREQFGIMQTVNTMLDIKIRSNLIVPRRDVEAYYNDHPEVIEATYTLERLFVPFSTKVSKQTQLRKIQHYLKKATVLDAERGVTFIINHSDVAPQKQFIYSMEPNDISQPEEINDGFEMFRLISKTPEYRKTLEESYRDIVEILRRPKYEELLEKYSDQLSKNVSIIYME